MALISMTISNFTELVKNELYPVVLEDYGAEEMVHPLIGRPVSEDMLVSPYGHKRTPIGSTGVPTEREDGAEIESTTLVEDWPVYMKVRLFSRKIGVAERDLEQMEMRGLRRTLLEGAETWGSGFRTAKEQLAANIFNKGGFTAGHRPTFDNSFRGQADPYPAFIYDGKPFFSASHPLKIDASTTYDNTLSSALSASAFNDAKVAVESTNAVNARGQKISQRPEVLLVPPALEATGRRVLESMGYPGTALNDINPHQGSVNVVSWRFLTDSDAWFLGERRGLMYFDSGAPVIETYRDPATKSFYVTAEVRFGVSVVRWNSWVGSQFSTS